LSLSWRGLEQQARTLLPALLMASITTVVYFVATMPVIIVPREFPFGILKVMPIQYWIALSLSVILLATSLISRRISFALIASLLLIVLIPGLGDLIYPHPRDVFAVVAAQRIAQIGHFSPADHVFLNFPGPELIFSSIAVVAGTSSLNVVRGFGLVYNPMVFMLSIVLFRRLGVNQRAAILSALILVMSFYMQGVLIYTSLLGFVFYLMIAGLILVPFTNESTNTFVIIVLFTAMVVSHAFSPFLTLVGIGVLLIGWRFANSVLKRTGLSGFRGDAPAVSRLILVPLLFILTTYWAYFAFTPFSWGLLQLNSVDFFSLIAGASAPLLSPGTVYQRSYVQLAELYAPALFLAFAAYFFLLRDKRRLQILLLILGLGAGILFALAGYLQEFLARIFTFAAFPLSYGIGRLFESNRTLLRGIAFTVLIVVAGLHLPAHYGQDSFQIFHDSTFHGVRFLAQHSFSNAQYNSSVRELSWHYYIDVYRTDNSAGAKPGSYYVLDYSSGGWILYSSGNQTLHLLDQHLSSNRYDTVYSNGMFELYLEAG
jgi:hypothetical protein